MKLAELFSKPEFLKTFHKWAALFWIGMAPVSAFTGLKSSIEYLVFLSVYAVITGHWSSWQAVRVEVKQDEE